MNILFHVNDSFPEAIAFCRRAAASLRDSAFGDKLCGECGLRPLPDGARPDLIAVLGGDGTVLRAVREYRHLGVPFWAVNFGHVGYLTDCAPDGAEAAFEALREGRFRLEKRWLLSCLWQSGGERREIRAINEIAIHRGLSCHALHLWAQIDGDEPWETVGDGLLASTATGSTAYNLAAGGPVLPPDSEHFILTPVCPRPSGRHPLILGKDSRAQIRVLTRETGEDAPMLFIDSLERFPLADGDVLEVSGSGECVCFAATKIPESDI